MAIEDLFRCPSCGGDVNTHPSAETGPEPRACSCPACYHEYSVVDGVLDFLPGDTSPRSLSQRLMEWKRLVAIYESRWSRAGPHFAAITKIPLEEEMRLIREIVDLDSARTVLDLACGTGLYSRNLAEGAPERHIIGLDLSWPMLHYASSQNRRLGIENLTYLHGDAHTLPLKDDTMDVANCCGALHLFPDFRQVLRELSRVVRPKGRLSAAVFLRPPSPGWLPRTIDKATGLRRFGREEIQALLREVGFEPTLYHAAGVWMVVGGVRET